MKLVPRLPSRAIRQTVAGIGLPLAVAAGSDSALAQNRTLNSDSASAQNRIILESMGARAFGGTNRYNPEDSTAYLPCDHGYVEWFIPPGARKHPLVFTHGSGTRGYQTTFNGKPGFQSIFLGKEYPVYLVDLPRTGRAGQGCVEYTYTPNLNYSRGVFNNRIGVWPEGASEPEYFPGVAFSRKPEALDQYFRIQYPEFNTPESEDVESDALAVLLEELYAEHDKAILFTHSSGNTRGWLTALKTDKVGAIIAFESCSMFPEGEVPPPFPLADGGTFPYTGRIVPLEEFLKLTKFPILVVFGDNIPTEADGLDVRGAIRARCLVWAETINRHGGDATILTLPEVGVLGNTHYPFADTNVKQVAGVISDWLRENGLNKGRGDKKDG
jgi:pimeloyl-ACP methyl ester carboxylesterase